MRFVLTLNVDVMPLTVPSLSVDLSANMRRSYGMGRWCRFRVALVWLVVSVLWDGAPPPGRPDDEGDE